MKCVRSIVEENIVAEAISAEDQFHGRMGHSTNIFALLQMTTEILPNFYSYFSQEFL